ncbi:TetR/AcrR family transcriptional regulator [Rheinheimera sp. 1928-s]|uniref:TetR/AcrR family transcriptional regulator n=1 Tax=Rheinheimera sp. 1928-s TaxID=3033803 RepID=UPI00261C98BC|nr:TetR/AcrR family transcriptional regulator [Rheinheimera sp. 1928-s]MDF3126654.1 TetR/AcrR family transcriptional regulator [Rheinheimera sp. 1928-s]
MTQIKPKLTRSEQKKQDVLRAAIQEFRMFGFAGASMDRIAELAGASKRTVYNHFVSKELLFDLATTELWRTSKSAANVAFDPSQKAELQLLKICQQCLAVYQQQDFIELARVVMAEYIRSPEKAQAAMLRMASQEGGLELWLSQAQQHAVLVIPDIQVAATQFWGMFKAFAFWPRVFNLGIESQIDEAVLLSSIRMFVSFYSVK